MDSEPESPRLSGARNAGAIGLFVAAALLALYFVPHEFARPSTFGRAVEFLVFGVVVGAYGTMVGAGGGFLIVPALLLVYHTSPEQAAGTSLTVVFLNAASGTASYAKQGRVDYRAGWWFALATLPGAVAGAYLARLFSSPSFSITFGVVLLAIAALLIWRPIVEQEYAEAILEDAEQHWWRVRRVITDRSGQVFRYHYNLGTGIVLSFGVGFVSSILGIGGGIIHVPALIHLLGFPAHLATATSHFILAISALAGASTHLALGHVLIGPAILMGVGVIGGAQVGARLGRVLGGSLIVRALSLALILVGIRLLLV